MDAVRLTERFDFKIPMPSKKTLPPDMPDQSLVHIRLADEYFRGDRVDHI